MIIINSCARHEFRVTIMKKTLTLAIMALLMGSFVINANAQNKKIQVLDSKATQNVTTSSNGATPITKVVKTDEVTPSTKVVKTDVTLESSDKKAQSAKNTSVGTTNINNVNTSGNSWQRVNNSAQRVNTVDWNKTISEFEEAVEKCVSLYQKMQKGGSNNDAVDKEYKNTLTTAENLKAKIEKGKTELNRTQVDRYNKANAKLSQVYAKR